MSTQRSQRRAARLAAVQALYQIDMTGRGADGVIAEFVAHRLGPPDGAEADREFFDDIVRGATEAPPDEAIAGVLGEGWAMARLGATLRAILRAGAWELTARPDIPPRVTVSEYVAVARGFVSAKEIGFVNGALDKLARQLRSAEMEGGEDKSVGAGG